MNVAGCEVTKIRDKNDTRPVGQCLVQEKKRITYLQMTASSTVRLTKARKTDHPQMMVGVLTDGCEPARAPPNDLDAVVSL